MVKLGVHVCNFRHWVIHFYPHEQNVFPVIFVDPVYVKATNKCLWVLKEFHKDNIIYLFEPHVLDYSQRYYNIPSNYIKITSDIYYDKKFNKVMKKNLAWHMANRNVFPSDLKWLCK